MTLKERLLSIKLLESLRKCPYYGKELQIETATLPHKTDRKEDSENVIHNDNSRKTVSTK